ncbi:MAG: hypothetical protein KF802_08115 [Bdellovibrionaceae bacterium]|nr:hypothetical protein [Pseudobdellovibrionaceae bacterium]MBX3034558.1 hypothetical protein [Pseudobdellovibrionaceae bacterium]
MNQKTIRNVAILIVIVFAVTVIVYPLIFNPDPQGAAEPAVELEVK